MATLDPLPLRPTNADLAKAIMQTHECLEALTKETYKKTREVKHDLTNVNTKIDLIAINQNLIVKTLNIDPKSEIKPTRPFMLMGQREAIIKLFLVTGASISAAMGLWKLIWTLYPFIWPILKAVNHMVTK